MASPIVEAFSLSHVAVLDGTTGAEEVDGDLFSVNSASIELDADSFDNVGDDLIRSTWNWGNRGNLSVQAGYIPFRTLSLIYDGLPVTSSGSGATERFEMLLWEKKSMNPTPKPVLIRLPSKDRYGVLRTLDIVLFKVQFAPITLDGPAYKDGLKLNYSGQALFSDVDEAGNTILDSSGNPTEAIGRFVSYGA